MASEDKHATAPEWLQPGTILDGKFRVERLLGVGGMGVVVAATHLQLEELVAIKVLLPGLGASQEAAARFEREARASVKIKSEHVVRVLDVAKLQDGTPYMVMEYLSGQDLSKLVSTTGPIDAATAAGHLLEACDAIAAAHALGIVHRDLKPANLFLADNADGTSSIKVLDFGISKLSQRMSTHDATLTKTSSIMGSPLYMAPEQMQSSKKVDARADIWALGCVGFELVVGRPPFLAESMPELCARILTEPAPLPSSLRPGIPSSLDTVLLRCLAKLPEERFQNVGELAQALLPLAPHLSSAVERILRRVSMAPPPMVQVPELDTPAAPAGASTETAWGQRTMGRVSPRAARWVLVALVGVLGLGVAGWLAMRKSASSAPLASAAASAPSATPAQAPAIRARELPPAPASAEVEIVSAAAEPLPSASQTPPPARVLAPRQASASPPKPAALQPVPASSSRPVPKRRRSLEMEIK